MVESLTADQPPESLRERKKRHTGERIYDAALELFARKPYGQVTVEEICARADVGRATFFRSFGSKAGLLAEFNRRLGQRIIDRIEADPAGSTIDHLWAVQDEVAQTWCSAGPAVREMAREWIRNADADDFTSGPGYPEAVELLADLIHTGQASSELTPGHDPRFVAWLILASLSAVTAGWLGGGDDEALARRTREALELLLSGLRG